MDNRPIGVFDSGIGGLTVVREIIKILPHEKIIYIGDTARIPWGVRGEKTIIHFAQELTSFLVKKKVKLIVVACHTASSVALPYLHANSIPVLGVIEPAVEAAVQKTKNGRIGIVGTPATVRSGAWEKALKTRQKNLAVFSSACPLLVPLVEEGLTGHEVVEIMVRKYLIPLKKARIDTLILACTHYPLLKKVFAKEARGVSLINPGKELAIFFKKYLLQNDLNSNCHAVKPKHEFFFTDLSYQTIKFASSFLGEKTVKIKIGKVSLENL